MIRRYNKFGLYSKRAFTLVEIIVVLVILAVLAAMIIPALVGYIKRAKKEKYVENAYYALVATQSVMNEYYGLGYITHIGAEQSSGGGSGKDNRWDSVRGLNNTVEERQWGEKVLELLGRNRSNEPYYPIDAPVAISKTNNINYLVVPGGTNIPLQLHVVSNGSGLTNGNFWTDLSNPNSLRSHSEPHFQG